MRRLHLIALAVFLLTSISCQPEVDRPNILWITAEDMSPVLGYLGDEYAITPNLDKLAVKVSSIRKPLLRHRSVLHLERP